ncbi:hypothetical protein GOBAR_AA08402 [Gossypium barbadense]|uniref:Histone deacetylase complex subunit SAP30 Sin3 binding domain-containing protein n=1 Tax=Gossypium barbadense TaxID=3634 RepID=A0A2P5Y9G2_GOSBA|nr:hypothetical protein GOBAR_AA08402 [Gossypium barbadense]
MLQHELCSSRILSPFRDEIVGDEELSVLPRHTKVIVTGNNRTKSVLVGLQGVVKKAVGLGGWHWLVLKNGVEVALQRNALSVLEHPTGNEVDDDHDFDNSSSGSDIDFHVHFNVVIGLPPPRNALSVLEHPTGNEVDDDHDFDNSSSGSDIASSIEFQRPAKPRVRHMKPWVPSASMKATNRSGFRDVQSIIRAPQSVNLARLDNDSLRRYCRHFKLVGTTKSNCDELSSIEKGNINAYSPRELMLNTVQQHFVSQPPLNDIQVISEFITSAKRLKTDDSQSEQL